MKAKVILVIMFVLTGFGKLSGQGGEPKGYNLCILIEDGKSLEESEFKALGEFLKTMNFSELTVLNTRDLIKHPNLIKQADLIWVYKNDSLPFKSVNSVKLSTVLRRFVMDGGKLILANQACMLITALGLETLPPETRSKHVVDEGYGRQLGYHAFREHPLFKGMNGGAYVLKPLKDTTVLQTGYFGMNKPANGKVTGVDWDYIFLREDSKLIMEYEAGKGKILCIGGYLLYGLPNRNRIHLETFTKNIFRYLTEGAHDQKCLYWDYNSSVVKDTTFKIDEVIPETKSDALQVDESELSIKPGKSAGNYWDLAGERLLLMGDDHGGITEIWAHPILCIRDYRVEYSNAGSHDSLVDLDKLSADIEILPSLYKRTYDLSGDLLRESITASPDQPYAVIHYDFSGKSQINLNISFRMLFRLMWPYSEKVLKDMNYSWNDELQAFIACDKSGDFVTFAGIFGNRDGISVIPSNTSGERGKMPEEDRFEMPSQIASLNIKLTGPGSFDIIIASSSEGFEKTLKSYIKALADPFAVFQESRLHADSILHRYLMIDSPEKDFNDGYRWAVLATDRFQVSTPGIGSSLVAGYATSDKGWDGQHAVSGRPGYGWYFGRDGAWSGFALLHYGDFAKVRKMLETFQRFQDLNGKIFHELSTSGIVHYDAADATPLYIILAGRYLRHSGDSAFIRASWLYIKKALDFCYSTDTDGDHLIENTNVGHGWEEGGQLFGSHTTLYLASCWAAALEEASYIAKNLGLVKEGQGYHQDALTVKNIINQNFWNTNKNYYYHGLMPDGSYKEDISIMPCIPMMFSQADRAKSQQVLPVIAADGFTSDWGCRIVPEGSPGFNPGGYHTGSVWPLFTGWAALAEFRNNNYLQGYSHLMSNILIYKYWGLGFIEEVLHGEIFQPFGVCHHQCWSETMALEPAIEGMLGYQPDALRHQITLKPWFPADWEKVRVTGIRLGDERVNMIMQSTISAEQRAKGKGQSLSDKVQNSEQKIDETKFKEIKASFLNTYTLSKEHAGRIDVHFQPVFPPGSEIQRIRVNGLPAKDPGTRETEQGWVIPDVGFWLDSAAVVEIQWQGGISALPLISHPQPGDQSEGFRIISTSYSDKAYTVTLQAPHGTRQEFKIWAANPENYRANGAEIKGISGNIMRLSIDFPGSETDYVMKKVVLSAEF